MPIDEMVQIEDKDDLTNCPIPNRSYKIPRALLPSSEKFIVEMKNSGWIEDSTSEFCSPVLIIPKGQPDENKGYRFVVDLRQLNARTKSLQYMVPELGEMWAKLRNAKFISKLDLRHGFWQMGLHPNTRHKTSVSAIITVNIGPETGLGQTHDTEFFISDFDILVPDVRVRNLEWRREGSVDDCVVWCA
jgi:hypothetical protein